MLPVFEMQADMYKQKNSILVFYIVFLCKNIKKLR